MKVYQLNDSSDLWASLEEAKKCAAYLTDKCVFEDIEDPYADTCGTMGTEHIIVSHGTATIGDSTFEYKIREFTLRMPLASDLYLK